MAGFLDKVKSFIKKDPSKVDVAIEKAGDFVDKKTEGKYSGAVDKAQEFAKQAADKAVQAKDSAVEGVGNAADGVKKAAGGE